MYINIIQTKYNYEEISNIKMTKNIKVLLVPALGIVISTSSKNKWRKKIAQIK
jgi:hypothetical protein